MEDYFVIDSTILSSLNTISSLLGPDSLSQIMGLKEGDLLTDELSLALRACIEKRFSSLVNSLDNYLENCYNAFLLYDNSQSLPPSARLCDKQKDVLFGSQNTLVPAYLLYRIPDRVIKYLDIDTLRSIQRNLLGKSNRYYFQGDVSSQKIRALDFKQIYDIVGNQIEELDVDANSNLDYDSIQRAVRGPLNLIQYWKGRNNISKEDYLLRKAIISFWIGGHFQAYEILRKHCINRDDFTARQAYYYIYALTSIFHAGRIHFYEGNLFPKIEYAFIKSNENRNPFSAKDYLLSPPSEPEEPRRESTKVTNEALLEIFQAMNEEIRSVGNKFIEQERSRIISVLSSRDLSKEERYYLALIQISEATNETNCRLAQSTLEPCASFKYSEILYKLLGNKINKQQETESQIEELFGKNPPGNATLGNVYEWITPAIMRNEILYALHIPFEQNLWIYAALPDDDITRMQDIIVEDLLDKTVFSKIDEERNNERIKSFEKVSQRENRLNLSFSHNENYSERREHIADNISKSNDSINKLTIHRNAVEDCLAVSIGNYKLQEIKPYLLFIYYYYLRGEMNTRAAYSLSLYLYEVFQTDLDLRAKNKQAEAMANSIPSVMGLKGISIVIASLINPFSDIKDLFALLMDIGKKAHFYIPPKGDQLKQYDDFKRAAQSAVVEHDGQAQMLKELTTTDFSTKMQQLDAFLDSFDGEVIPDILSLDYLEQPSPSALSRRRKMIIVILIVLLCIITAYNIFQKVGLF